MSARTQLQSKPVADLRAIAEGLGLEYKGLQKAKLIDLLIEQGDAVLEAEVPKSKPKEDDDLPSVVNSGDSQIKKGETRVGFLDILPEGYGFLRCDGYKPSEMDVYVPAGIVKKFRMRKGDSVEGPIRAPRAKEKYPALVEPTTVNGADPELLARRVEFDKLTPLFPDERLKLEIEGEPEKIVGRIVDLIAPIGKGQRGLIVSPPKAGKTTILKLLMRYYEPQSGRVLVNGIDVQDLTLDSVRDGMGFVSQEPFLFFGSLKQNVAYNREAGDDEIMTALEMAGAAEFVNELENGLDTMVGDRGTMLSGGQRARVSLARALLKKPSLLVLDEASSALDAETEKRIQENLLASGSERTTIAVAHRLSTIRNADEIISMVDGGILERGGHDELISNNGVYASQWRIQTGEL